MWRRGAAVTPVTTLVLSRTDFHLLLRDLKPQALSNSAWAYATAGHPAPKLFAAIADVAEEKVFEFNPQELSNTAWAVATAGHRSPSLFEAIASAAQRRVVDEQRGVERR